MEGSPTPNKPVIGGARGVLASFAGISPPQPPSFGEPSNHGQASDEKFMEVTSAKKRKNKDLSEEADGGGGGYSFLSIARLVEETTSEGIFTPYQLSEETRAALDLPKPPTKPKNAYLYFASDQMDIIRQKNANLEMKSVAILIGEKWKNIVLEEKLRYVKLAAMGRQKYEEEQTEFLNTLLEKFELIKKIEAESNSKNILIDKEGKLMRSSYSKKKKMNKGSSSSSKSSSTSSLVDCTVCGNHCKKKYREHPVLKVPICDGCIAIYESGEFTLSEEDLHEIYCRWCGDGGILIACDKCPKSFCCDCLSRNLGEAEVVSIQEQSSWTCVVCSDHPRIQEIRSLTSSISNQSKAMTKTKRAPKKRKSSEEGEGFDNDSMLGTDAASSAEKAEANSTMSTSSLSAQDKSSKTLMCQFIPTTKKNKFVVCEDISLGRERNIKIKCVNEVDDSPLPPFTYIASNVQSQGLVERLKLSNFNPDFLVCCDCPEGCDVNPENCACIQMSSGMDLKNKNNPSEGFRATPSYNVNTKRLMEPRTAVYECNAACKCNHSTCSNRLVGKGGPFLPLEVFRCLPLEKGWGVRCSTQDIPAGTFIACYQGELLDETAVEHRGKDRGDEYLFNLDLFALDSVERGIKNAALTKELSLSDREGGGGGQKDSAHTQKGEDDIRNAVLDEVEGNGYLLGIDAKWWGNVGRFFNHSCNPNMEKQPVFVNSHDVRIPSVAFFTNSFVPKGTELTYNYGYVKGSVEGKQMICRCGESGCIERMY